MQLTKRHYLIIGGGLLVVALTLSAAKLRHRYDAMPPPESTAVSVPPPEPTAMPVTLPEHTAIRVTLDQSLATNRSRPGDHFAATASEPVLVHGRTAIPKGAHAEGLVEDARKSERLKGRARLELALQSVEVDGQNYDVRTMVRTRVGRDHKKRNLGLMGGGAGGGLLIGALAGGGKGALIGGAAGLGARGKRAWLAGKKKNKTRAGEAPKVVVAETFKNKLKGWFFF